MGTTFSELIRRVFLGFPRTDGEAYLAVKQGINDALIALVGTGEFDDLLVRDTTSGVTVASTQRYSLTGVSATLGLTRPKDIDSIILHDGSNSRKLIYVAPRELDLKIPYPEQHGTGRPQWYTQYGDYVELFRIPDDAYTLYTRYSQWPDTLSADSDQSPLGTEWDHILVFLSKDIANAYLSGQYLDFVERAKVYLKAGLMEARSKPDHELVARPFEADLKMWGEWWKEPFTKSNP